MSGNSNPNLVYGQVPTAEQWNQFFSAKQDYNAALDTLIGAFDGSADIGVFLSVIGAVSAPQSTTAGHAVLFGTHSNVLQDAGAAPALLDATGALTTPGGIALQPLIKAGAPGGTDDKLGGRLTLQRGAGDTTGTASIAIDVYNGVLRILENGGSYRGVSLDLTMLPVFDQTFLLTTVSNLAPSAYTAPTSAVVRTLGSKLTEIISLADFIGNPGNVRSDTDAFGLARTALENVGPGGKMFVPPRSVPYLWDGETISNELSSGKGLTVEGVPFATRIQVATLPNGRAQWLDIQDAGVTLRGLSFFDPNSCIPSNGVCALRVYGAQTGTGNSGDGLGRPSVFEQLYFEGLYSSSHNVVGMNWAINVDGADGAIFKELMTVNVNTAFQVVSGGIDCSLSDSRFYNPQFGVYLNTLPAGQGISHTEGFICDRVKVLCPDPPNGGVPSAFKVNEALWLRLTNCEALQMATGGIGLDMQVGSGHNVVMVEDVGGYWEGGTNGFCIKGSGNLNNFVKRGGYLSNATKSGVSPMNINGNGYNRISYDCGAAPLNGSAWASGSLTNIAVPPDKANVLAYRNEAPPSIPFLN